MKWHIPSVSIPVNDVLWSLALAAVLSLLVWHAPAQAQVQGDAVTVDLSGAWKWRVEPGYRRGDTGNDLRGWHRIDHDDGEWESLSVGTPWEKQHRPFNGIAWYRKSFQIAKPIPHTDLILELGTPDDGCEVYLNGESLGRWAYKQPIRVLVSAQQLRSDGENVIAVRVWDWYKQGGLKGDVFQLRPLTVFGTDGPPEGPASIALGLASGQPQQTLRSAQWQHGWRDEGLSDTRPRLRTLRSAFRGEDALELDVWYPNSTEFLEYTLGAAETGRAWARAGIDYISFWYRTEQLRGDITLRLSAGPHRWKGRAPVWEARVRVSPGAWTRVALPLDEFTSPKRKGTSDAADRLDHVERITHVSIGYGNHHLESAGSIRLTGFQVQRSDDPRTFRPVPLTGTWKYRAAAGAAVGEWSLIQTGEAFPEGQAVGPLWYQQQVLIPARWRGQPLRLQFGPLRPGDGVDWNGVAVRTDAQAGAVVIPSSHVRAGELNTVRIRRNGNGADAGLGTGPFRIAPAPSAAVLLAWPDQPANAAAPRNFEMGTRAPKALDVLMRFAAADSSGAALHLRYYIEDCFDRTIATGETPLHRREKSWEGRVPLRADQARTLFYGEWFRVRAEILDEQGNTLAVHALPNGPERHLKLQFKQRDGLALPALASAFEPTPFGPLKLIDTIDLGQSPDLGPHPYKEGGIRNSWVGRRAYTPWHNGIVTESLRGRRYVEARNNQFFAYRIGRGRLQPHKAYLLRLLVPDDKSRYFVMDIKAGRNSQGTGYHSVRIPGTADLKYKVSGDYHWYDHIVINDDVTYGYRGSRTASSEHGFWVAFHDIGRAYAAAYDAGPAVAEMRLYELPDHVTPTRGPNPSGRVLMMDWERQPESPPEDVVRYAQLAGLNAVAPTIQKWAFHGFWHSKLGFKPPDWYKTAPVGQDDRDIYRRWLDATRGSGVTLIPRIEYGGGPDLPREARVIGPNGKIDPVGRYARWGANILHPATLAEMKALMEELIGAHIDDNPQLGGLLWRQRQDRIKTSYGRADVERFARETGAAIPAGDAARIAQWAARNPDYAAWWQQKRADFLAALRTHLRTYRDDLVLYYYNWDQDQWNPGLPKSANTPQDWSDYYNVDTARRYERRRAQLRDALPATYYIEHLRGQPAPHQNLYPSLLESEPGIRLLAPIPHAYLSSNRGYLEYFRTVDGVAVANVLAYEERARWNLQGDDYESSELTPGPGGLAMHNEFAAVDLAGADVITTTTYTWGRGWISEFKAFSDAFLAGGTPPRSH